MSGPQLPPIPPHLQRAGGPVLAARRARPPVAPVAPSPARERLRAVVRGFGEILITLGLVLLLFCGYQLWWTDITSDRASNAELRQLSALFAATPESSGKVQAIKAPADGEPFARMYIPAFGASWVRPVVQGVSLPDLHKGVGHYPKSAMPGQVGNFAVAGHRTTNGHPFRNVDKLEIGDKVFVETRYAWYTYTITTVKKIVLPGDTYVVQPVPEQGKANAVPSARLLTMTSCNPPYSATQRIVTFGRLTEARPRGQGPPAGVPAGVT